MAAARRSGWMGLTHAVCWAVSVYTHFVFFLLYNHPLFLSCVRRCVRSRTHAVRDSDAFSLCRLAKIRTEQIIGIPTLWCTTGAC